MFPYRLLRFEQLVKGGRVPVRPLASRFLGFNVGEKSIQNQKKEKSRESTED